MPGEAPIERYRVSLEAAIGCDASPRHVRDPRRGWFQGSAAATANICWFADRGWLVISAEYRLSTVAESTWDSAPDDMACALAWTTQNAARFGGDPQRVVIAGQSAGGNLAINLGYGAASGQAQSGCGGQVPVPAAVVVYVPVVDPQDAYNYGVPMPGL